MTGRGGSFLGREVDVPRRQREAVGLADGRVGDDLGRDREVARHLPDDEELLRVLLAEVRPLRADEVEQDRDDRGDALEMAGPRGALERLADGADADGACRIPAGRPPRPTARTRGRRPPRPAISTSRASLRGYFSRSFGSPNWRGLTKIETTVVAFSARARWISARWPSCSQPIVGTRPTGRGEAASASRSSARVRTTRAVPGVEAADDSRISTR